MVIGHKKQWEFLEKKHKANQLSHAYLFTGAEGIGKRMFAEEFAEFIGCKFPDLKIIEKKEDKEEIDISQIRDVQNFLSYKSYNGGFKVVIVDNAERMNTEAQNCFLKTLEEPKGNTLLILVTSKPDMMLPTIASRCQVIKFFKFKGLPENKEKIAKEKEILDGLLPVINSSLAEKFKYVKSIDWETQDLREILEVTQKHFRKLLLSEVEAGKSVEKIKKTLNLIEDLNNKFLFTNANPKLALEILLMET